MCVRCGAMKNDSVREELAMSVTPISAPLKFQAAADVESAASPTSREAEPRVRRVATADLGTKKTSPTLAEFINKNSKMPDWRLQLQNSVRQRAGRVNLDVASQATSAESAVSAQTQTNGANALKVAYDGPNTPADKAEEKLSNALKRIEASRRAFQGSEKAREGIRVAKEAQRKFPYSVVSRSDELPSLPSKPAAEPSMATRPKLVSSLKIEKKEYDTNKLVPIPEAASLASSFEEPEVPVGQAGTPLKENWSQRIEIREAALEDEEVTTHVAPTEEIEPEPDAIDDLAPIPMRFNAGLFDLIIGAFATFVLLSPLLAFSEGWFSFSGFLLFASVLLVVMFLYLTAAVGFLGQTFGMKMFSLELVDVDKSEFPTLHQAAVNSAVFLFSLAFGGLGFIPILLNDERRAAHDLVSGTILVREV